jgi:hypothetical protein
MSRVRLESRLAKQSSLHSFSLSFRGRITASRANGMFHSPCLTHALVVATPWESVVTIDIQSTTLAKSPSLTPASDDPENPQHAGEVASGKQE